MKRLAVAALVVALSAVAAFGAVQDFGKFTLDIADGWTATQTGPAVVITKDDKTASMSITIDSAQGNTADALAAAFVESFKGSFEKVGTPEKDDDGDYSWDMENGGIETHAMLSVEDGNYMLITMTNADAAADDMMAILNSVQEK
ncbi:MAG: hypothetical protein IJS28_11985 [Synergistaceae bacterium]|nr:hypothetical protein [Synergistaceae bacterium]